MNLLGWFRMPAGFYAMTSVTKFSLFACRGFYGPTAVEAAKLKAAEAAKTAGALAAGVARGD